MKIQKYLLIVLTFLAGIVPGIAQEKKPALPNRAQTVIIDSPDGIEYVSAVGRFKILFPGVRQEFEGTNEVDAEPEVGRAYEKLAPRFIDSFSLIP